MRIVGGKARGRPLRAAPGDATRPTADRVRQSLFDRLGQRCDELVVLDLYSGTGALALEALSRGALRAVLVEQARPALEVIELNIGALGFAARCRVMRDDVARALTALGARGERFDLIFSDPPYALRAAQGTLDRIAQLGLLSPGGRAVLERDKREPMPAVPAGIALLDETLYGDTSVSIFQREERAPAPAVEPAL